MFKHKNDEYRVPRREKLFRGITVLALLVALAVLIRDVTRLPAETVPAESPEVETLCRNAQALVEQGGEVVLDCGGVWYPGETLVIEKDTTIYGASELITTITGAGRLDTLFRVKSGVTLSLNGIRLEDSTGYAVYIERGARVLVNNVRFTNHTGTVLYNEHGYVQLGGSTVENNRTSGVIFFNSVGALADIENSSFRNNRASSALHPWSVLSNRGTMNVKNSIFENNMAANTAGVVITSTQGNVNIERTLFQSNMANRRGSSIIFNDWTSMLTITNSQLISNHSNQGSILKNRGDMTLEFNAVSGNTGQDCINDNARVVHENFCKYGN